MAVPTWQPGTLYQPGDIVQPITAPPPTAAQVENGDFAAGNVNWDFTGGAEFSTTGGYSGNGNCVRMPGNVANGLALNRTQLVVPSAGSTFEATAMINQGASIRGATRGWVEVLWFDIDDVQIGAERGNVVEDGSGGAWHQSKVTATRPAGAAYARAGIALFSVADHNHPIWGDNLSVSGTFAGLPDGLVYKAVQPESGFSAPDEPAWPAILGQQVIDNEVIWEAVASTRVTWEASPIYVSGAVEPVWPTEIGGFVRDGTIDWKTVSRRVEDPNCPDSNIVVIAASKVFAGDDDIVRYSATVNPLDWTTVDDAGYLPTGLQNYGSNPVAAMGLYRGNLVVFNAEGFQLWQVDEDPASMALIDALPLGSTQHKSIAPVSNDLFFASSQGVRSIGIAASSTNYQAGDVGMPIDPLVEPQIRAASQNGGKPLALFHPALGQYWLAFPAYLPPSMTISGDLPGGEIGEEVVFNYQGSGGVAPRVFSIVSGSLPPGLSMDAAGRVTGTRTTAGIATWTVRLTDSTGKFAEKPDSSATAVPEPPTPLDVSGLSKSTSTTSIAVPVMPAVDVGDMLVMRVTHLNNVTQASTLTAPAGWNEFAAMSHVTSGGRYINEKWWYRIAGVGEGGTTVDVTAQHAGGLTGQVLRIKAGTYDESVSPFAQMAYFDAVTVTMPTAVSPWGYAAVSMIASVGVEYSSITILPPVAWPLANQRTTTLNGTTSGTTLTAASVCSAPATATSFSPGAYTLGGALPTIASTILVKGN